MKDFTKSRPVSAAQLRAKTLTARFAASLTPQPVVASGIPSLASLEARATELRDVIEAGERPHATPPARARATVAQRLLGAIEAQLDAIEERVPDGSAPDAELLGAHFMEAAPDMLPMIAKMRALLIKFSSGTLSVHDDGDIIDALARSGFLLARADGEDVSAAVAAYEASLHAPPDDDDDDDYNNEFGRYGRPEGDAQC